MSAFEKFLQGIKTILDTPIAEVGKSHLTLWSVIYLCIAVFLLVFLTAKLRKWIVYKVLEHSKIDLGVRIAVGTIVRYGVLVLGFIIIMQTAGIDLSALTILAGALGVGIGFGLQNVTNNFVSGIIILFERPIKVGDRIEIGDVFGDVVSISMRSTTVITNDNIAIIVPNSDFISSKVINWSYNDRNVRFNIPVGVSYNEDPERIKTILLEIASSHDDILKTPKPEVLFTEMADSSLNFTLRVWADKYINRPSLLKSLLYFEIFKRFKKENIEIPFPQRDLHIKNTEINVRQSDSKKSNEQT